VRSYSQRQLAATPVQASTAARRALSWQVTSADLTAKRYDALAGEGTRELSVLACAGG
jgi:hypothetical protein